MILNYDEFQRNGTTDKELAVVFGHSGFVGGSVLEILGESKNVVMGVSSAECDLLDRQQVRRFLDKLGNGARIVFFSCIHRPVEDSYSAFCRNVEMVENLAASAPQGKLASVIYISSVDVYGHSPPLPITEQTVPFPSGYYGTAKLAGEFLLRRFGAAVECPISVLRLPGIYGRRDKGRSVVGRFVRRIMEEETITLFGDGTALRDFVLADDLADLILNLFDNPFDGVLNVATGKSCTIRDVVQTIEQVCGRRARLEAAPTDKNVAGNLVFDITHLRSTFPGFQLTSLSDGIENYVSGLKAGE